MKLIDLINELEGAGLIITDMEEVESELERLGIDSEMVIPQNWEEDSEEENFTPQEDQYFCQHGENKFYCEIWNPDDEDDLS